MEYFWNDAFRISVLLNPFAVLSTFIALTGGRNRRERADILVRTCVAAAAAGLVVLYSGDLLFSLLGIDLDLFKVGGGTVLMICSISLVWGREKQISRAAGDDVSIAVVPLAVPMAVGPGTAAGLIVIGSERATDVTSLLLNAGALIVGIVVLSGVLALGVWGERWLRAATIAVITKLTGLFLSAIAAKMILEGACHFLGV